MSKYDDDPARRTLIRLMTVDDLEGFQAHFDRHRSAGPAGLDVHALAQPLSEPAWQRWFIAVTDYRDVVGHVDLKGERLRTALHRCELGIGVERPYRRKGLGRRLIEAAIDFARDEDTLSWIDLRVFSHNTAGKALYRSLGFSEVGVLVDRFRIEGQRVDDVIMTLNVGSE